MDVKDRARFINSVGTNPQKTDLGNPEMEHEAMVSDKVPVQDTIAENNGNEPESIFASGLPGWDLVPPQVVVRRVRHI